MTNKESRYLSSLMGCAIPPLLERHMLIRPHIITTYIFGDSVIRSAQCSEPYGGSLRQLTQPCFVLHALD